MCSESTQTLPTSVSKRLNRRIPVLFLYCENECVSPAAASKKKKMPLGVISARWPGGCLSIYTLIRLFNSCNEVEKLLVEKPPAISVLSCILLFPVLFSPFRFVGICVDQGDGTGGKGREKKIKCERVSLFKQKEKNYTAWLERKQTSVCAKEEKSLWRQNNGVKLKQRGCLLVCGTEWQRFDCVRRGGGTAVWLYQDETLRSSIVSPYLGHGSVLTKRHYSSSPCSCGQIMRMFSWEKQRIRLRESHQIKTMSLWKPVFGVAAVGTAEWMDLSPRFVCRYCFSVGCLCLCQCWQARFHSPALARLCAKASAGVY